MSIMQAKLSDLNILYLESIGFDSDGYIFWVNAAVGQQLTKISFKGIMHVVISRDFLDLHAELDVIEVEHEYRLPTPQDLKGYRYLIEKTDSLPQFHLITFHGSTIINIICETFELCEID
jgi:hypothetical protein